MEDYELDKRFYDALIKCDTEDGKICLAESYIEILKKQISEKRKEEILNNKGAFTGYHKPIEDTTPSVSLNITISDDTTAKELIHYITGRNKDRDI